MSGSVVLLHLAGAIALGSATGAQSSTQSRFLDAAQLRCTVMLKKGEETRSVVIRLVFADATGKDANFKPHWKLEKDGEQGAIEFDQAVLQDGRSLKLKAVAITSGTGRTGIATDVDHHYLERYGSLAFGGLIQGAGQVGQMLVAQNSTTTSTASSTTTSGNSVNWGQAAMGATLPLGQALTAAASQNFSRKNTMSADGQTLIGVLFLEPVTVQ